ncbi:MAG TPA: hypothetical protein ENJ82_12760, partial [Bacteroidetes bacterium]|nr:hypothetical protein [Bacteroidota bacterium]
IYFMYDLLDKYGSDPRVTYLINHRELYFIPILNPDGYVFNATTHPNGGGLWRKNRHANGSSTFGVDLNRNYSFAWGHDNIGSSPDPNAATFRGTAPFSEPETMALRQFCAQRDIRTALNYHAWGNSMVIPWGYARNATLVDQEKFHRYGSMLTESNEYLVGSPFQTLGYAANGTSADWMYGNVTDKPQIMALSPEIGGPNDWFWPTANRIIPLCKAQLQANFRIACLAGSCIKVKPELPCELEGSTVHLPVRFMNFGSEADSNFTARFTSSDPHIVGVPVAQLFLPTLGPDQEILDSFSLALAPNIPIGTVIRGVVHTFLRGNIVLLDTVEFSYGVPQVLFSENGESSLNNWTGNWARTTEKSYSGNYSITDSPFSLYAPNASSTLTLQNPIDLSDYTEVMLRYHTTWELQRNWDYVIVNASRNGVDFDPVTGRHTQPGSGSHQPYGEPVYDGSEYAWVLEKIDLSAYSGHDLYLQFVLGSNSNQERDGFYFDDLCVTGYKVLDSRKPQKPFVNMHLFPNPGEGHFQISGMKDGIGPTSLQIFSLLGNKLRDLPAN